MDMDIFYKINAVETSIDDLLTEADATKDKEQLKKAKEAIDELADITGNLYDIYYYLSNEAH